jgi:hypothetical protein
MMMSLFQVLGNVANTGLFVGTAVVSYCMMYRYPNESYFDASWLHYGFCVANPDSEFFHSHFLAFYSDCIMALALAASYYHYYPIARKQPDLQEALLFGSIPGVFFHGVGHLYYGTMDATGFSLKWDNADIPKSLMSQATTLLGLAGILKGALALASTQRILLASIAGTIGLTLLNVPSTLNFVYIQGIIYICSAAHMLSLDSKHKQSAAYLVYPLLQFLVLAVGVLESTLCQKLLTPLGGHVVFDTTISMGSLIAPMLTTYLEKGATASKTETKKAV